MPRLRLGLGRGWRRAARGRAREPAQRCALETLWLGLVDRDADGERVRELDVRQLARGVADDREVAGLQRPLEARVRRSLTRHERMFAFVEKVRRPGAAGRDALLALEVLPPRACRRGPAPPKPAPRQPP